MSDPGRRIVFRLEVRATLPLTDDPTHPDFYTEAAATSAHQQRRLERVITDLLKPCEAECAVELLDYVLEDE